MSRPIVLLHGWGMNAAAWSGVADSLARDRSVHILELPGHGERCYAGEQSLAVWAEACLKDAPERADWIGWSLGGQVALQAALLAPERIGRLVLTASAPRFVQGDGWPHAMPVGTLGQFAEALGNDYQGTIQRFLALQVRGSEQSREVLRLLKEELAARPPACPEALEVGLRLLRETDLSGQLDSIQSPLTFLFGERDALVPIGVADDLAVLAPRVHIERIAGAAHAPFLSHPAEWLRRVERCLS